jgi:hypothetical protein
MFANNDRGGRNVCLCRHKSKRLSLVPLQLALRPAWIAFKHGGERNIEDLANVKETGRTDPVATPFIFLNLLEADAQCLPSSCWLMLSASRRSRIRAPMYASTGVAFLGACLFTFAFFISAHF